VIKEKSDPHPPGLLNPNFRNQEFFVKKQELIRRFSPKNQERNQETFCRNQKENRTVTYFFFGKARIPLSQMFKISVFNKQVMKRSVLLSGTKKNRKIITYSLFYCSFRSCSLKNLNKTGTIRF
jgi:hypothetical protein